MYDRYLTMPREMSWLSPRRRKTTGNVTAAGLREDNALETGYAAAEPGNPRVRSPAASMSRVPMSSGLGSPPVLRPFLAQTDSSKMVPEAADGNLFYAYARKADDVRSRFLLTFASARIANEWWSLLQTHFPDCTRPGPQLFSFKSDDLLGKAWKHEEFAHLKSKWMYIQFNDAGNVGGAAQGIIPVQDAQGHMLGGSAGNSSQLGSVKEESGTVHNELETLESHFERMMEAVEKNAEQIAALAEERRESDNAIARAGEASASRTNGAEPGYFDTAQLSTHLGRISDLLERNQAHVEALSQRQEDGERRLREVLEETQAQKRADCLDMSQLSTHLDRIQKLMERNVHARPDSAKDLRNSPPSLDITPLTDRLEKVLGAVEHNSSLMKEMLVESAKRRDGTQDRPPASLDLSPMTDQLGKIHSAIEQQSSHIQALVGFAGGEDGNSSDGVTSPPAERRLSIPQAPSLAPLSEHLEQIFTAVEEGAASNKTLMLESNKMMSAMGEQKLDFAPLERKLEELARAQSDAVATQTGKSLEPVVERMAALLEIQKEAASKGSDHAIDLSPLATRLDELLKVAKLSKQLPINFSPLTTRLDNLLSAQQNAPHPHDIDFSPLTQRLDDLNDAQLSTSSRQQDVDADLATKLDRLVDGQQKAMDRGPFNISLLSQRLDEILSVHRGIATETLAERLDALGVVLERAGEREVEVDLGPLVVQLKSVRAATERLENRVVGLVKVQPLVEGLEALGERLDGIREATGQNAELLSDLVASHLSGNQAERPDRILTPLLEHLSAIREATTTTSKNMAELLNSHATHSNQQQGQKPTDLSALIKHLKALHTTTEDTNALLRSASSSDSKALVSPSTTSTVVDFSPLTESLTRTHSSLQQQADMRRSESPGTGVGDVKFILSALTSHLAKIQAVTDANAAAVRALREKPTKDKSSEQVLSALMTANTHLHTLATSLPASQKALASSVASTSDSVRALAKQTSSLSSSLSQHADQRNREKKTQDLLSGVRDGQVQGLLRGQAEVVEGMRMLMGILKEKEKGCGHVVVPPPRKTGKKVVGFVYEESRVGVKGKS